MNSAMKDRNSNRLSMPTVAAFVDELRAAGLNPKVLYASENGKTVGRLDAEENAFTVPANYRLYVPLVKGAR